MDGDHSQGGITQRIKHLRIKGHEWTNLLFILAQSMVARSIHVAMILYVDILNAWRHVSFGSRCEGWRCVADEGKIIAVPKVHSCMGKCTMPLQICSQMWCPTLLLACVLTYIMSFPIPTIKCASWCVIIYVNPLISILGCNYSQDPIQLSDGQLVYTPAKQLPIRS